jgi:hypothetical protein
MIKAHWAMWIVMALFAVGAGIINAGNADILADQKVIKFISEQPIDVLSRLNVGENEHIP